MKRLLAKEFLIAMACMGVLALTWGFTWARNSWLQSEIEDTHGQLADQNKLVDSLRVVAQPVRYDFIDLFDSTYVSRNGRALISPLPWRAKLAEVFSLNDFASDYSRVYLSRLAGILMSEGQELPKTLVGSSRQQSDSTGSGKKPSFDPKKPFEIVGLHPSVAELGRNVKLKYPGAYDDLSDEEVGRRVKAKYPDSYDDFEDVIAHSDDSEWQGRLRAAGYTPVPQGSWSPPESSLLVIEGPDNSQWHFPVWLLEHDIENIMALLYPSSGTRLLLNTLSAEEPSIRDVLVDSLTSELPPQVKTEQIVFIKSVIHEDTSHRVLRQAYVALTERGILKCGFDALLNTVQSKPTPPSADLVQRLDGERNRLNGLSQEGTRLKDSVWDDSEKRTVFQWVCTVLLVMVYPFRLLIVGTRWAIMTLRT